MAYLLIILIMLCFGALFYIVREKTEIFLNPKKLSSSRISCQKKEIRKELVKNYLSKSPNITLTIYRSLTGLSYEQAGKELEEFASQGYLYKTAFEGEPVFCSLESRYAVENIKDQINRG